MELVQKSPASWARLTQNVKHDGTLLVMDTCPTQLYFPTTSLAWARISILPIPTLIIPLPCSVKCLSLIWDCDLVPVVLQGMIVIDLNGDWTQVPGSFLIDKDLYMQIVPFGVHAHLFHVLPLSFINQNNGSSVYAYFMGKIWCNTSQFH